MNLSRPEFITSTQLDSINKVLGYGDTVTGWLGSFAEKLSREDQDGGWLGQLESLMPWLADTAEVIGDEVPVVKAFIKIGKKLTEQKHPYVLGAIACTLAYREAVRKALAAGDSALLYQQTGKLKAEVGKSIRDLAKPEASDLSTFALSDAQNHEFVMRADAAFTELLRAAGASHEQEVKIFNALHEAFVEQLKLLLANKATAEKFAPFKAIIGLGSEERRVQQALLQHARYQIAQYADRPLFRREPFALKDVYSENECGKLLWGEIKPAAELRGARGRMLPHADPESDRPRLDPFSEANGLRHDLLQTVMGYIEDPAFKEAIIIQGLAGAGKSSFTLRLCAELWQRGFHPIRIRLKMLALRGSLIEALNQALEYEDPDVQLPFQPPRAPLTEALFETPYGNDRMLSRYVLILDGWDELITDNRTFREKVQEMLAQVRDEFLRNRRMKVRVIVTGRPSDDVTDGSFLRDDTPVLTLRPFRGDQLRDFVSRLRTARSQRPLPVEQTLEDEWSVPELSIFEPLLQRYEQAFQAARPKLVDKEKDKWQPGNEAGLQKLEVIGLPLLAFLTVRVMSQLAAEYAGDGAAQQRLLTSLIEKPTSLYRSLTDLTCERAGKWAYEKSLDREDVEQQWRYYGEDLRYKLQRTAAAMAALGVEFVSEEEWQRRDIRRQRPEFNRRITQGNRQDAEDHPLAKLMVSFYFKGGHSEQSCEFAHKSFREYFLAEAIVETLKDYGRLPRVELRKREAWRDFEKRADEPRYELSRGLAELLAPQWLSPDACEHLEELLWWEIERSSGAVENKSLDSRLGLPTVSLTLAQWERIRDGLAELWWWWAYKVHLRPLVEKGRDKRLEIIPAFVHELSAWHAPLASELDEQVALTSAAALDAQLGEGLFRLCTPIHYFIAVKQGWKGDWAGAEEPGSETNHCQTRVIQANQTWTLFALSRVRETDKSDRFFKWIGRINAVSGRPQGFFPGFLRMSGVDLRNANLSGVILRDTTLEAADLEGATLKGATLENAILDGAVLNDADLFQTDLSGASFNYTNLQRVNLGYAILQQALFYNASLDYAKLNGAALYDTTLEHVSLNHAILINAILDGAVFNDVSFANAHLSQARLGEDFLGRPTDLSTARDLTVKQLREISYLSEKTVFPPGEEFAQLKQKLLQRQSDWKEEAKPKNEEELDNLLKRRVGVARPIEVPPTDVSQ